MMALSRTTKYNLFLIAGALLLIALRFFFSSQNPDEEILSHLNNKVTFEGEVSSEPDVRDTSARYTVSLENTDSKILLVSNRFPAYEYGDRLEITGKLQLPKNFEGTNGIEFDYVSYLAKDNIYFLIYQPEIKKIETGGNFIFKNLFKFKNYFAEKIARVVPEPNSSLLDGLIFGARQQIGDELLTQMKEVGLIHIVAISGYNVTIIATSILYATSYLRRRKLGLFLSALSIILFAIMVGLGSTVIRASIMALIAILGKYLGRNSDALRALFVAAFLMLIQNPFIILQDPSFQLSVAATLGLILFSPIVLEKISFVTEKFGLREIFASTFAVQIFLLPLLIKLSGIFSIISFVVNLIVLPFIPYVMLVGFLTGFLGLIPYLGFILSWPLGVLSYLFTEYIIKVVEISDKIPFAFLNVGSLPTWIIVIWYLFYAWAFWKFSSITSQFRLAKKSSM